MGKSSPQAPAAPDYSGAATAQSQGSVQANLANNLGAHPNIFTPLGSQTWAQTGTADVAGIGGQAGFSVPQYSQYINLSDQGQQLFNQYMGLSQGLMGLGQGSLDQVRSSLGHPQDLSSVQDVANASYGAQTARLDPQWAQNREMQQSQLANQGLTPGGEAYDNAMRVFNQGQNDAYSQARLNAISTMPQTYQMSTAQRMQPLNEFNAIRTGAQAQMPQFQPTQYAMGAQGANTLGATQMAGQYAGDLYNQQVAQQNSMTSGLFGLGGALGAAGVMRYGFPGMT